MWLVWGLQIIEPYSRIRGTNSSVFNDLLNVYENGFERRLSVEGWSILLTT